MKSYLSAPALIALALGATACGGAQHAQQADEAVVRLYPIATRIPTDPSYLLIGARLDRSVGLIRDLFRILETNDKMLVPATVDEELREGFAGASFINTGDSVDLGLATDRNIAVFSTGVAPTFAFPVANKQKLQDYITKLAKDATLRVSEVGGVGLSEWILDGKPVLSFAFVDDWFFLHVVEGANDPWLEQILATRGKASAATEADLSFAHARAAKADQNDLLGLVRWPTFMKRSVRLDPENACESLRVGLGLALGRTVLHAAVGDGKAEIGAFLEMPRLLVDRIRHGLTPPSDGAPLAARADAALWWAWNVDPTELDQAAGSFEMKGGAGDFCTAAFFWLGGLYDVGKQLHDLRAMRVAVLALSDAGERINATALAWLQFVDGYDQKKLFPAERSEQIAHDVKYFSAPTTKFTSELDWVSDGSSARIALGHGALDKLLAPPAADPHAVSELTSELVGFEVHPDKIPDAKPLYQMFENMLGDGSSARALTLMVAQFRHVLLRATLETDGIRVAGRFELR